MKLTSLAEDIHAKMRKTSQNTDFDMRKYLGTDKALQSIQVEMVNNTSNLTEIDKRVRKVAES